jgi:translation elongation factor EF-Tu-like GTPase
MTMQQPRYVATLTVLGPDVGGRQWPIYPQHGMYRPHAIVSGTSELLGIAFLNGPEHISAGETAIVEFQALYHPNVDYNQLKAGAQFVVVEGGRIVAVGKVNNVRFP